MAKPPRTGALYPGLGANGQPLIVERFRRQDANMQSAAAIQRLMQPVYSAQFEQPTGPLPEGLVAEMLFDPGSKKKVRKQHGRICSHMDKFGSEYWLLRDEEDPQMLVGLVKTTPRGLGPDTPFAYVNDIAVHPDRQHSSYGRIAAHAALKFGAMSPGQPLALDGYAGSAVNGWFEREWGMVARGIDADGVDIGSYNLPQINYVTEEGLTVGGIVRRFEDRIPELALGEYSTL